VAVGVGAGLAVVEVGWWDPLGVAVVAFAGGPALVGGLVVVGSRTNHRCVIAGRARHTHCQPFISSFSGMASLSSSALAKRYVGFL
jgi:hypothetical protein